MNAHQRRRGVNVAHDQGHQPFDRVPVCGAGSQSGRGSASNPQIQYAKGAPAGWKIRLGDLLHAYKCHGFILQGQGTWGGAQGTRIKKPADKTNLQYLPKFAV